MDRVHDIGGTDGFGPIDTTEPGRPFEHEWEARVLLINRMLIQRGLYTLDEFRYRIEQLPEQTYHHASYYERWLLAIEQLLAERGVLR